MSQETQEPTAGLQACQDLLVRLVPSDLPRSRSWCLLQACVHTSARMCPPPLLLRAARFLTMPCPLQAFAAGLAHEPSGGHLPNTFCIWFPPSRLLQGSVGESWYPRSNIIPHTRSKTGSHSGLSRVRGGPGYHPCVRGVEVGRTPSFTVLWYHSSLAPAGPVVSSHTSIRIFWKRLL